MIARDVYDGRLENGFHKISKQPKWIQQARGPSSTLACPTLLLSFFCLLSPTLPRNTLALLSLLSQVFWLQVNDTWQQWLVIASVLHCAAGLDGSSTLVSAPVCGPSIALRLVELTCVLSYAVDIALKATYMGWKM